jgi:phosphate uptake regulator
MYDELMEMLTATEWMFEAIGRIFFEGVNPEDMSDELYARDVRVNKTERKIRRQIVEHLAIRPGGDVPACLVLMSLVKDVERIGDYCKNLYEVRAILGRELPSDAPDVETRKMYARILDTFKMTKQALLDGDEDVAWEVTGDAKMVARELDDKVAAVAASDLPARQAVCRALTLRHMKRVHAHLCNVASSVVQPVHKLDYVDEGSIRPPKQR